ncbi:glycosyltransferase [Streptomyces sp. NWU339]|uniref:glycosyltransferase n=1 Tax=Streptomyces sp. NWU339 TaxID=2185284 RepID=UPI00215B662E|nr:glycosyltransferase [Streptomyces sp. NWU339]
MAHWHAPEGACPVTTLQISVVAPCFNESEVIETSHAALLSAVEPTRQAFEVCCADDRSGDDTRSLLRGSRRRPAHSLHGLQPALRQGSRPARRSTHGSGARS